MPGNIDMIHHRTATGSHRRRRGIALLLTLFAVAIAATLALSFLSAQSTSLGVARNIQAHPRARYVAESGLELAIAYVRANADWRTTRPNGTWVTDEAFADGTFTLVGVDGEDINHDGIVDGDGNLADDASDPVTVTSTGTVAGTSHVATAVITPNGPGATYDFATNTQGTDVFAYSDASTTMLPADDATPTGPSTVLTSVEYDAIEVDDGAFFNQDTSSVNEYARHRFEFHISEDPANVSQIDVTWSGKGINTNPGRPDGGVIYIWRFTGAGAPAYELLAASADTEAPVTVVGSITTTPTDYVDATGKISVLVISAGRKSGVPFTNVFYTDYVSVSISTGSAAGTYSVRWQG